MKIACLNIISDDEIVAAGAGERVLGRQGRGRADRHRGRGPGAHRGQLPEGHRCKLSDSCRVLRPLVISKISIISKTLSYQCYQREDFTITEKAPSL